MHLNKAWGVDRTSSESDIGGDKLRGLQGLSEYPKHFHKLRSQSSIALSQKKAQ
ncbi:MAG TPA: hypothetical protein V6C85_31610 [Allocoleopsis sp.]